MRWSSRIVAVALLALWAGSPARALPRDKDEWIEVATAHFTLLSNASERNTERIAVNLERLRLALARLSPGLAQSSPEPTAIFVFRNETAFLPYQRLYQGKPVEVAGYFMSRPFGNYVAINGDLRGDGVAIMFHEYLHYVLRNSFAGLPLWLNEGLAEYYSTFEAAGNAAKIGLPIVEHLRWLRDHDPFPLTRLFAIEETSSEYNEGNRRGGFYAQSWALTHYLVQGDPERRRQAAELFRLLQANVPQDEAVARTLGDPAVLERELRKYVQGYLFNYSSMPFDAGAPVAVASRPAARADVLARLGELLLHLSEEQLGEAESHFRAALELAPEHGPATAGLGQLAALAGRRAEAGELYRRAARQAPSDLRVQVLFGEHLLAGDPTGEERIEARQAFSRVVALAPEFGEAWARLGLTWTFSDVHPAAAIQALETAHRLMPSRMDVAYNLLLALARAGRREEAEALVSGVLELHADKKLLAAAREALLSEDRRLAEDLVGKGKYGEALAAMEEVYAKSTDTNRRLEIAVRLSEIRHVIDYNRFVDQYNQAINLANRGDYAAAIVILEPLAEATRSPAQLEMAKTLLGRLQEQVKKKKR